MHFAPLKQRDTGIHSGSYESACGPTTYPPLYAYLLVLGGTLLGYDVFREPDLRRNMLAGFLALPFCFGRIAYGPSQIL
jgi:hypothetical protein